MSETANTGLSLDALVGSLKTTDNFTDLSTQVQELKKAKVWTALTLSGTSVGASKNSIIKSSKRTNWEKGMKVLGKLFDQWPCDRLLSRMKKRTSVSGMESWRRTVKANNFDSRTQPQSAPEWLLRLWLPSSSQPILWKRKWRLYVKQNNSTNH